MDLFAQYPPADSADSTVDSFAEYSFADSTADLAVDSFAEDSFEDSTADSAVGSRNIKVGGRASRTSPE